MESVIVFSLMLVDSQKCCMKKFVKQQVCLFSLRLLSTRCCPDCCCVLVLFVNLLHAGYSAANPLAAIAVD